MDDLFPFHNRSSRKGPVAERALFKRVEKHIKIQSEFIKAIKEYIYKNGLVDATAMEVEKYEYQESTGRLGIIFKLNNPDENKLRVIINANGNIDISNYN